MRNRPLIVAASLLALLVVAAGGVSAYDFSRDDLIAKGVRAGGVDVGGLRAADARAKLQRELLPRLDRPVVVNASGRSFRLTPRAAALGVNIGAMVDQAVDRSRSGGIVTRTLRAIGGNHVSADVPVQISYSRTAVAGFVAHVRRVVSKPARDATLQYSGDGIGRVAGAEGVDIDARLLRRDVEGALVGDAGRAVALHTTRVAPKVTTADLARVYPYVITINRSTFTLRFFKHLQLAKSYRIAVGQVGLETPAGLYHVQNKAVNPAWHVPNRPWAGKLAGTVIPGGTPENPIKARWMGIFDGAGIHGTDVVGSLGSAASHGCIRMAIPDVIELYDQVPIQTPVYIA